jgi:hypothetical protein
MSSLRPSTLAAASPPPDFSTEPRFGNYYDRISCLKGNIFDITIAVEDGAPHCCKNNDMVLLGWQVG